MVKITIEGYLTQHKLAQALKEITGDCWLGNEIRVPDSRRRWDMAFRDAAKTVVVEYDGPAHYRNSLKIKADNEKDVAAKHLGYKVIRFPYWIQLDSVTLEHYFGLTAKITQDFPHGFITTKIFPASFCEMGIERFRQELNSLPSTVRSAVLQSLQNRSKKHGIKYVIPTALRHLISARESALVY